MKRAVLILSILLAAALLLPAQAGRLRLATTTSTEQSGLLGVLIPPFEKLTGMKVDVVAVGTGKALKLGENGDADVVLVHAREAEDQFVAQGFGVNRRDVMHNDFILLGPVRDPAGIRGMKSAAEALKRICAAQINFISRGDQSGTHVKELELWRKAALAPEGRWYKEVGQGMGEVISMAGDLQAYTLADRGTWLSMKNRVLLTILAEGDPDLFNPYGVIAVNPARHPQIKYMEAMRFIAWMTSAEGQKLIEDYQIEGEPLFFADSIPHAIP
jgi:tungstate transport system substrate-binding protein